MKLGSGSSVVFVAKALIKGLDDADGRLVQVMIFTDTYSHPSCLCRARIVRCALLEKVLGESLCAEVGLR
jgi:hypothetical protein